MTKRLDLGLLRSANVALQAVVATFPDLTTFLTDSSNPWRIADHALDGPVTAMDDGARILPSRIVIDACFPEQFPSLNGPKAK